VHWTPPKVGNPAAVKRVVEELDRGLKPARPIYLKWICDKLSALPTQTSNGLNAALWSDNVIDVCSHYPEDLLQTAALDLLRTKTFRPSPAEIVAVIEPRYLERQRMLERARLLMAPIAKAAEPFKGEPLDVRLRSMRDSLVRYGHTDVEAAPIRARAGDLEQREPEEWARNPEPQAAAEARADLPKLPAASPSAQARLNVALARDWRKRGNTARADALEAEAMRLAPEIFTPAPERPNEPPMPDEIPEAM
jgi:hypothetical protein